MKRGTLNAIRKNMARPLRIQYPGAWYQVMNRGRRGGGTGGAACRGVETQDPNLGSVPVEIIDLKSSQPLKQNFRTKPKVFY